MCDDYMFPLFYTQTRAEEVCRKRGARVARE